jgi:hypothetical protein
MSFHFIVEHSGMDHMILVTLIAALAIVSVTATIVVTARDGYRRTPTLAR